MMSIFLAFSVEQSFSHLKMIQEGYAGTYQSVAQLMRISIEGPEIYAEFEAIKEHNHSLL